MDLDTLQWQTVAGASRRNNFDASTPANFVWDEVRFQVVAFGGGDTRVRGLQSDDWLLLTSLLSDATGASTIYDPVGQAIVSFGAYNAIGDIPPLRLASSPGASWQQIAVATGPGARSFHVGVYDSANARMIVQGGLASVVGDYVDLADAWALTLVDSPKWEALETEGPSPPARRDHVGIYDPVGRRLIIYGGSSGHDASLTPYSDLWSLSLDGVPRWTQLDAFGRGPGPLERVGGRPSAVYDPDGRRMLVLAFSDIGAVRMFALELGAILSWHEFCSPGVTPADVVGMGAAGNMVITPDGLFFNDGGASFRFNLETPYCDG